jgi:hypothetical protein
MANTKMNHDLNLFGRCSMVTNYTEIQNYLTEKDLKPSYIGFRYLIAALQVIAAEPDHILSLSAIYKEIADFYNVKPSGVERAIGYTIKHLTATNKEFIYQAADDLIYCKEYNELKRQIS